MHRFLTLFKILLLVWIFHNATQYITQRTLMAFVYPAQSELRKNWNGQKQRMDAAVETLKQRNLNLEAKPVFLEKDGMQLSGWTLCRPENKENGKWILQAVGNKATVEVYLPFIHEQYAEIGFNTLLINNPGVGNSQGTATPQTIGQAQDQALTYLEDEIHAHKIVLAGHSLGGAAIGQAVLQHNFKKDVQYLVVQQMTFGKLSHVTKKMKPSLKWLAKPLIRWAGIEMDNVAASHKLATLNITECVINRKDLLGFAHDGVIPGKATLGHLLCKTSLAHCKTHYPNISLDFTHNSEKYIHLTTQLIQEWDSE